MAKKASSRNAQGAGTIRKKTVTRNGKPYTYWEARYTEGRDPGTGKQVQRSIYGRTQKEVREKLQAVAVTLNTGTYTEPDKMTVGEWLDMWLKEYVTGAVKPFTLASYTAQCENHIKPGLGAIKLTALNSVQIQKFYNGLKTTQSKGKGKNNMLSPKTIKNVHGVLHKALDKAAELRYIAFNPSDPCTLPGSKRKKSSPLNSLKLPHFSKPFKGVAMKICSRSFSLQVCGKGKPSAFPGIKWISQMARSSSTPSYNRQRSAAGTTIWPKRKAARAA